MFSNKAYYVLEDGPWKDFDRCERMEMEKRRFFERDIVVSAKRRL